MADEGLTASWNTKYNAGSNPVAIRLVLEDLERPIVQDLLRASHAALHDGASAWSERQAIAERTVVRAPDDGSARTE